MWMLAVFPLLQEHEPLPFQARAPVVSVGIPEGWRPAEAFRASRLAALPTPPRVAPPPQELQSLAHSARTELKRREARRLPYGLLDLGLRILAEMLRH